MSRRIAEEVGGFLGKIDTKLADACAKGVSLDSRFDIAYEAMLQIGLVALRVHDLRPDSRGGHHVLALQALETTIGFSRAKLRVIDRSVSEPTSRGSFEPSKTQGYR